MPRGKVYLIGAGPGDPSLITLRGAEVLGLCDVVLYDALAHPALLEHLREGAEARFVGKRGGGESEPQELINQQLLELAREGKIVGRLKGGDPLLFARGAEEALVLADAGIDFEIIPGIASPVAISAYAGIPLTHRDHASSVLFLTGTAGRGVGPDGHDWRRLATRAGTICVFMGMARLREIASSLIEHGRPEDTPTAIVQWGARPEQRTITGPLSDIADLAEKQGIGSPALVIIGTVVSLRERLRWYDRRPLFGKRILVLRAKEQAGDVCKKLRALAADPISAPTIEIHPPPDPSPLARAVTELATYDWVAFTSANSVTKVFAEMARQGRDARAFGSSRIAAIGPGTAASLERQGIRPDLVSKVAHGEGLAEALLARSPSPRVLLPRALVARDAFPDAIVRAGGHVDIVAAYETRPPSETDVAKLRALFESGDIDAVLLTSSSTIENLCAMLGPDFASLLGGVTLASIGPVTTATCEKLGLSASVTAATFDVDGLLTALETYFST